jgi:predicted GH43/DUF377 family glycosyl hydrolase
MSHAVRIERLFGGLPIISPTDNWWESGVTFNTAAVHLEPLPENLKALDALLGEPDFERYPDGIVALHYRARPKLDPGLPWTRSFVGLSVHRPDLTPIKRFAFPVVEPGGILHNADDQGVEDPRITFVAGKWWMVYCGVSLTGNPDPNKAWIGSMCLAASDDLLNWHKCGPILGEDPSFATASSLPSISNKDGVLFPDFIGGKIALLHRPMKGEIGTWGTNIALADHPIGPFTDLGQVHSAKTFEGYVRSWAGAGSVPIKVRDGVYLSIEHTGNFVTEEKRKYVLDAFLYDFNQWDPMKPENLVLGRLDDLMRPETDFELYGPSPDSVGNVLFACGSYVHEGWLYIPYGGGDTCVLGARLRFDELVAEIEARSPAALSVS